MFLVKYQGKTYQATRLSETQAHIQSSVKKPAQVVNWTELEEIRNWPYRLGQSYQGSKLLEIEQTTLRWDNCTTHHSGAPCIEPWSIGDACYVGDRKYTIMAMTHDVAVLRRPGVVISHPLSILRRKPRPLNESDA